MKGGNNSFNDIYNTPFETKHQMHWIIIHCQSILNQVHYVSFGVHASYHYDVIYLDMKWHLTFDVTDWYWAGSIIYVQCPHDLISISPSWNNSISNTILPPSTTQTMFGQSPQLAIALQSEILGFLLFKGSIIHIQPILHHIISLR